MIKLFNTLTRKVEEFQPIEKGKVGMYTCGPTVYDFQHIGNLRTMIFSDLLRRTLAANTYQVKYVRNITDVDDKIINRAKEKNISIEELTSEYSKYFFEDLKKLNVVPADVDPKATEHVSEMISYIEELIKKGLAYKQDNSIYFDISKFPSYGKLSRLDISQLKTGTRVLSDEYSKDNVQDFALWKSASGDAISWESPWGQGRPGWHIECSVMSQKYLGDTFDLHLGGVDLIFPHHENEIAQSEGKTGKPFVNYFVHGEHLLVDNKKMAKSENNFYTLKNLEEKGFDPMDLRYLYLTTHYRQLMNFTWESLEAAKTARAKLVEFMNNNNSRQTLSAEKNQSIEMYRQQFMDAINNDLGTPAALAVVWEVVKSNIPNGDKKDLLLAFDEILGIFKGTGDEVQGVEAIPEEVQQLVQQREGLRKEGKFEEADKIRKQIEGMGYIIKDTSGGTVVKKK